MPNSRPPYAPEFRQKIIELVRSGRTPEELSKEFEPTAQTIHNWVRQADRDEGRRDDGPTTDEREELARLRRENRRLKQEQEILKKCMDRRRDASPDCRSAGTRLRQCIRPLYRAAMSPGARMENRARRSQIATKTSSIGPLFLPASRRAVTPVSAININACAHSVGQGNVTESGCHSATAIRCAFKR